MNVKAAKARCTSAKWGLVNVRDALVACETGNPNGPRMLAIALAQTRECLDSIEQEMTKDADRPAA